jgi:hypothetical protein
MGYAIINLIFNLDLFYLFFNFFFFFNFNL